MLPRFIQQHRARCFSEIAPNVQRATGGKALRIYDLERSTAVSAEWQTVTEVLGGTALTQTDADRKPAVGASANGLQVATFDGTDVWLQTLESGNNGTSKWWLYMRVKPADFAATQQIHNIMSSGAASVNRSRVTLPAGTPGALTFEAFVSGSNGRIYTTPANVTAAAWNAPYVQFDSTAAGVEADTTGAITDAKMRIALGNTFQALTAGNVGSGGTVSALLSATGSAIIGGSTDSDTPVTPLRNGGQIQLIVQGQEPLTAAELAALNLFQFPT